MKKTWVACAAGLLLVTGAANAISVSGEAGQHYTNLGVGMSTGSSGLGLTGNWARSGHDGNVGSVGLNFGVPLGPLTATVGAKALYLSPKDGKSGGAVALGGGLEGDQPLLQPARRRYFAPESFTSGVKAYNEASGGLRWKFRPLSVDVGYRYMQMEGKDGRRDNTLADGPYVGVGLSF
ncbi:YfaZ family protein [Serratia ureilytica]